jgi:hypothetical protein
MSSGDCRLHVGYPWRMRAESVSQVRDAPWLIMRDPPLDSVAEPPRHNLRIACKRLGGIAVEPSATALQRSGQIPVMQRHQWRNPMRQQRIRQLVVKSSQGC